MIRYEILLPDKLSLNKWYAGTHWSKRRKMADEFHWVVAAMRKECDLKPRLFPVRMTYKFYFQGRALDTSNCAAMVKLLEDGFVKAGVLPGDGPAYVREITIINGGGGAGDNHVVILIDE